MHRGVYNALSAALAATVVARGSVIEELMRSEPLPDFLGFPLRGMSEALSISGAVPVHRPSGYRARKRWKIRRASGRA